jgi:hypothetical protein
VAFPVAVDEKRRAGLALRVDEAGRHHLAGRIDDLTGIPVHEITDRRNPVPLDADVNTTRLVAGTVQHVATADDQIELGRPRTQGERQRARGDQRENQRPHGVTIIRSLTTRRR